MPGGLLSGEGIGGEAWDEQVDRLGVGEMDFPKSLVSPHANPPRPHPIPSPYLYEYLIFPNLDIPPKPLYNLKSDNMS